MIIGKNITLRLIDEADLETMQRLQSAVLEKGPHSDPTIHSIVHLKKKYNEHGLNKHDFTMMLIIDSKNDIVGMIQHFKGSRYSTGYELGLTIFKKVDRSKGYATDALNLYSAYLFETQDITRLELATSIENIGAQKVAERCHYQYEGINRQCCLIRGVATDLKRYSILRHEVSPLSDLLK